jgi:hypothetical protein
VTDEASAASARDAPYATKRLASSATGRAIPAAAEGSSGAVPDRRRCGPPNDRIRQIDSRGKHLALNHSLLLHEEPDVRRPPGWTPQSSGRVQKQPRRPSSQRGGLVMLAPAVGHAFATNCSPVPQRAFGLVGVAVFLAALAAAPAFCYHTFAPFPGSSDGDGGGGPGSGPPPPPPGPPPGGAPLADADQARTRRRDHDRSSLRDLSRRRRAVEPVRRGVPAGPGSQVADSAGLWKPRF